MPDILLLLGMQARTGELVIESGNNIGTILFHEGKILQAFSPYSQTIGDQWVEEGLISETELLDTLKHQKRNSYVPLGSLLHKTGKVTFEILESVVQKQIRQAVKEFQSWKTLSFTFTDKDIKPFDQISLSVYEFVKPENLESAASFLSAARSHLSPHFPGTEHRSQGRGSGRDLPLKSN